MRLVACDLDGTVVRADQTISARTLAAFDACAAQQIGVVFVTGRPVRWMPPVAQATGHRGLAVCGNGAVIYDLGSEQIVHTRALTHQTVLDAVGVLRGLFPDAAFALETLSGFRRESRYRPRHDHARAAPTGTVEELVADGPRVTKILCRSETLRADPMLALARPALEGIAEPVHSNASDGMLEISALGVSKASTLALITQERGIAPHEVVAFGDMPNDIPMLRWAGVGYAMADGHPEVIAIADEIAPPCGEDGVAQVLEALLGAAG